MDPEMYKALIALIAAQSQNQQGQTLNQSNLIPQEAQAYNGNISSYFDARRGGGTVDNLTGQVVAPHTSGADAVNAHNTAWSAMFQAPSTEGGDHIGQVENRPGFGWGAWMPGQGGAKFVPQPAPSHAFPGAGIVVPNESYGPTTIVDSPVRPGVPTSLPLQYLPNNAAGTGRQYPTTSQRAIPVPSFRPSALPLPQMASGGASGSW